MKVSPWNPIIFSLLFIAICLCGYSQSTETGLASYYGDKFEGKMTASGEVYRSSKMTAAHRTLPFGTRVKVTNLSNNKSVTVTVNDRGPFVKDRIIDVSKAAAVKLDYMDQGVAKVKVEPTSKIPEK